MIELNVWRTEIGVGCGCRSCRIQYEGRWWANGRSRVRCELNGKWGAKGERIAK